jgi:glycosyltransferase involved in cell wall biosynthesis
MGLDANGLICLDEEDGTPFEEDDDDALPPHDSSSSENGISGPLAQGEEEPCSVDESEPASCGWELPARARVCTRLSGVVYTSVLTPSAGRKNWEDLITAFCWAFRDTAEATLILKLTGTDLKKHHHQLLMLLTKLSPFKCRVITLNGYLSDTDYAALVEATTYYVNASLCEGLCLPLVEFLGEGIPALAPDNTAMADYIEDDLAFVVASYPGVPTVWPHGDNEVNRTSYHQIDWESLMLAYRRSYQVAMHDPGHYQRMARHAGEAMQEYCSAAVVKSQLHAFLCPTVPLPSQPTANIPAALQAPLSVDS